MGLLVTYGRLSDKNSMGSVVVSSSFREQNIFVEIRDYEFTELDQTNAL